MKTHHPRILCAHITRTGRDSGRAFLHFADATSASYPIRLSRDSSGESHLVSERLHRQAQDFAPLGATHHATLQSIRDTLVSHAEHLTRLARAARRFA